MGAASGGGPKARDHVSMDKVKVFRDPGIGEMLTSARRAVRLAKGVTSSDQSNNLRVVHAHSTKGLTNIQSRRDGVTVTVGALGVNVDETHVSSSERLLKLGGTCCKVGAAVVADVIALGHESCFRAPEDALIRLPCVGPTSAKSEDWKTHLLEGSVTSQEKQVGP